MERFFISNGYDTCDVKLPNHEALGGSRNCGISFLGRPYDTIVCVTIIIGSDRRTETKQGIEGKIVRFRSGRVRDKDRRSEAINFGAC